MSFPLAKYAWQCSILFVFALVVVVIVVVGMVASLRPDAHLLPDAGYV
jgi:hypothetical protein